MLNFSFSIIFFCIYLGARVILACRDMEKAQTALTEIIKSSGNDNVVCMKLDLSDTKSIREFATNVQQSKLRNSYTFT